MQCTSGKSRHFTDVLDWNISHISLINNDTENSFLYPDLSPEKQKTFLPLSFPKAVLILQCFYFIHPSHYSTVNNDVGFFTQTHFFISVILNSTWNVIFHKENSTTQHYGANLTFSGHQSWNLFLKKTQPSQAPLLEGFCLLLCCSFTAYNVRTRHQLKSARRKEKDKPPFSADPRHKFTHNTDIAVLQHKADLTLLIPSKILHPGSSFGLLFLGFDQKSEHDDKFFLFIFLEEIGRTLQPSVLFIQPLV